MNSCNFSSTSFPKSERPFSAIALPEAMPAVRAAESVSLYGAH